MDLLWDFNVLKKVSGAARQPTTAPTAIASALKIAHNRTGKPDYP